jgi:hypothetical protein
MPVPREPFPVPPTGPEPVSPMPGLGVGTPP